MNLKDEYTQDNATIDEKRKLIRTFASRVELVSEKEEIMVEFYPDFIAQSISAGNPARIVCTSEEDIIIFAKR